MQWKIQPPMQPTTQHTTSNNHPQEHHTSSEWTTNTRHAQRTQITKPKPSPNPKRRWLSEQIAMSFIGGCVGRASLSWRSRVLGFVFSIMGHVSWFCCEGLGVHSLGAPNNKHQNPLLRTQRGRLAEKIQADNLNRNDWVGLGKPLWVEGDGP